MRVAIVMPTWIREKHRVEYANRCFTSFMKTVIPDGVSLMLCMILRPSNRYKYPMADLCKKCWVTTFPQDGEGLTLQGCDQPMVYGCELADAMGADYLVQLGDDTLFTSRWLCELADLIGRHPDAVSWSVYRSAHTAIHEIFSDDGKDCHVRSINGNGLTVSAAEWRKWGLHWNQVGREFYWVSPSGKHKTLDMHHYETRQGERWVTSKSYIDHIGKSGTWMRPHLPEYAANMVEEA